MSGGAASWSNPLHRLRENASFSFSMHSRHQWGRGANTPKYPQIPHKYPTKTTANTPQIPHPGITSGSSFGQSHLPPSSFFPLLCSCASSLIGHPPHRHCQSKHAFCIFCCPASCNRPLVLRQRSPADRATDSVSRCRQRAVGQQRRVRRRRRGPWPSPRRELSPSAPGSTTYA